MAKIKFRLKDPETGLPTWARGKNLPVKAIRFKGTKHTVDAVNAHGGHEIEIDDADKIGKKHVRHMDADPRFERV